VSYGVRLPSARRFTHDNRQIAGAIQDALDPHHSIDHTKEDHITIQSPVRKPGVAVFLEKGHPVSRRKDETRDALRTRDKYPCDQITPTG
jgi:hypothetical protein